MLPKVKRIIIPNFSACVFVLVGLKIIIIIITTTSSSATAEGLCEHAMSVEILQ